MSHRSTEQLVHDLAEDVSPVRPILRLRTIVAAVVAVWAIAVASLWMLAALPDDFVRGGRWGDPAFVAVLVGLALLASGATLLALAGAVPGRENVSRASGGAALCGIALAVGGGLWAVLGAAAPGGAADLAGSLACMGHAGALALLPVLVSSLFLARGFVRHPILYAGFAATGTVALGGLVVHVGCRAGGALHMLLGHALAPLVLGLVLAVPIGLLVRLRSRHS